MAKKSNDRKDKALILALSTLLMCSIGTAFAGDENTQGELWLRMNPDTRTGFVWGYTVGLSRGFALGCDVYRSINPPKSRDLRDDPFAKCLSRGPGFSRSVDYYVSKVTEFYQSYPLDREVPFEEVLKRLSDSQNMTPAQIHRWAEQHQHAK